MTTLNAEHMRAAFIRETGPADSIIVGDVPIPRPGPGTVLVHNTVMAVNHVDTYIRSGAYATARPVAAGEPFIVGRDLAGTVVEVGAGVTGFAVGDAVWCNSMGHDGRQGSFSDFSAVPAERLYPLPARVTPESMVSVAHTGATAYLGLVREARLLVGETIFVGGAAGGVGSAAVQLAHAMGARVLASCAPHDAEWVRSCGADQVFDRTDAALLDRVYASAAAGIDVWWDTTGRLDLTSALPLMGRGGRVLVTAARSGSGFSLTPGELYTRDVQLRGFALSNASVADLAEAAAALGALLARGSFKSRVAKVLSLEEAAGAHRLMESHAAPGKLLVKPGSARPKPHVPGAVTRSTAGASGAAGAAGGSAGVPAGSSTAPKPGVAPTPGSAPKPGSKPGPKPGVTHAPVPDAASSQAPESAARVKPHPPVPKPGSLGEAPTDAAAVKPASSAPAAKPGAAADGSPAASPKPHPSAPKLTKHTTESAPAAPAPAPKAASPKAPAVPKPMPTPTPTPTPQSTPEL